MSGIDELLAASRAGAAHVETGRFRLDWKKALDKIKEFQLADPHRWVLEIVQAAVAGGATSIAVTTDSDDVVVAFDGAVPSAEQLGSLFDHLFAGTGELAPLRQLALGVNAALALQPRFIRIDAGDGAAGHRFELSGYDDLAVTPLTEDVPAGVRVHVRDRTSWRRVIEAVKRRTAEGEILAAECRWCPVPIELDGERLDGDFAAGALVSYRFAADGVRGVLALRAGGGPGQLTVCMLGVRIVDHLFDAGTALDQLGLVAVIDDPGLIRNASHSDIHRDARWQALLDRVRTEAVALVDRLCQQMIERPQLAVPDEMLIGAIRLVLRGMPADLPPQREVLLDRLAVVELATTVPGRCTLRLLRESVHRRGRLAMATRRRGLRLDALPDDLVPVLGPPWLADLFGVPRDDVDDQLAGLEAGMKNRMRREQLRREPELQPREAFVQVPVVDPAGRVRGELGLDARLARSLAELGSAEADAGRAHGVFVVHCTGGVPLGSRWLDVGVWRGAAVVESPDFEPEPAWTDVVSGPATAAVAELIANTVPALAQALARDFPVLPPPQALIEAGGWTADGGPGPLPPELAATWAGDPLAALARQHIDAILHDRTFERESCPWLWSWKVFHLVDGTAVSLDQIDGHEPVGDRPVPAGQWRRALGEPWGAGQPDGLCILNLTRTQRDILQRQLGRPILDGAPVLHRERSAAFEQVAAARRREHNLAQAALRRQPAEVPRDDCEVIVDLELPSGRGQVGLLRGETGRTSAIRVLVDQLPLVDLPLTAPVPVHAVVDSPALSADAAFAGLADPAHERLATGWVRAALPRLLARFAGTPAAAEPAGQAMVWSWLDSLVPDEIDGIPAAVLDLPLVRACGGGRLSLRAVREDAAANDRAVRAVAIDPGRSLPGRPILICDAAQRATLRRVVPARIDEFGQELDRQLEILERKQAPSRAARLDGDLLARAKITADGYHGEIGVPVGGDTGWVDVLYVGTPVQRRPLDLDGLPLVAVISSDRFTVNPSWTKVHENQAWRAAVEALRAATDRLIVESCAAATDGAAGTAPLRAMLRLLCGRRFAGRPQGVVEPEPGVDSALAVARIWETADPEPRWIALAEIAAQASRVGSVWVVESETGRVAEGRIILRCGGDERRALAAIWSDRLHDGARVLARDDAAWRRRAEARPLVPVLVDALAVVDIDAAIEEHGLRLRGQVGVATGQAGAAAGLTVTLGVDGRELCTVAIDHPVRGLGRIDVAGLKVNREWTGAADPRQQGAIGTRAAAALWDSVTALAGAPDVATGDGKQALADALAALLASRERPALCQRIEALPLFRTADDRAVSLAELRALAERDGAILAAHESIGGGRPRDGRLIVLGDDARLDALRLALGARLRRDDDRWRTELEGARRFDQAEINRPHLRHPVAASVYFQSGPVSGIAGLRLPRELLGQGDESDLPSIVALHIGRRQVTVHELDWHPAVEAWVDDDRLTPASDYRDVVRDDAYRAALAVVEAQVPELCARAAELGPDGLDRAVWLRLCRLALDRREALAAAAAADRRGREARLLDARLWPCAARGKPTWRSTADLVAAEAAGSLAIADADTGGVEPPGGALVVLVDGPLHKVLTSAWRLPDWTARLQAVHAREQFLYRAPVPRLDLDAAGVLGDWVLRAPLEGDGWAGEIGIPADAGREIAVHIHASRRLLQVRPLEANVAAAVVAEWSGLAIAERWDGPAPGESLTVFDRHIRHAVWRAYAALAAGLDDRPPREAARARSALLAALVAAGKERAGDDHHAAMIEALGRAPLFRDSRGDGWSVIALQEKAAGGRLRSIRPETHAGNDAPIVELVLVIGDDDWQAAIDLLPVDRDDQRWLEECAGQANRASAPTSHRIPRGGLVETDVARGALHGRLALDDEVGDGSIGLFSGGRKVEDRPLPGCPGLVGWIDGPLATDRAFRSVTLAPAQAEAIEGLYDDRLAAAVELAHAHRRRRGDTWSALCRYVHIYLTRHVSALGGSFRQRRDHVLAPPGSLPAPLHRALACPVFQDGDGDWVPLATLLAADEPRIVIAGSGDRDLPDGAVVVRRAAELPRLLAAVVGGQAVLTAEEARAAEAARQQAAHEERERRRLGAHGRVVAELRALLREIRADEAGLSSDWIRRLQLEPGREGGPLVADGMLNRQHPLWEAAVAIDAAEPDPDAISLLALAVIDMAADREQALVLAGRMIERVAGLPGAR